MAQKLTDLEVDRVDVVGKAAINRIFMVKKGVEDSEGEESIQEEAPEADAGGADDLSWEDDDVSKSATGGLRQWAREIIRKVAGRPGPEEGAEDMGMTAEEVKKAMKEAVDEGLLTFTERLDKIEKSIGDGQDEAGAEGVAKAAGPFVKCSKCGASIDVSKCDTVEKAGPGDGKDTEGMDAGGAAKPGDTEGTYSGLAKADVTKAVAEAVAPLGERLDRIEKTQGQRQSNVTKSAAEIAAEGKSTSMWSGLI